MFAVQKNVVYKEIGFSDFLFCFTFHTWIFRCQLQAYWTHISIHEVNGSPLTDPNTQTVSLGLQNGFTRKMQSLSTIAGTILVSARDPAELSMDMQNAIEENRLQDIWKLFEQHKQMAGFPRQSIVNKLLTTFAESLDVQWLEKAYGLVEQALRRVTYLAAELILEIGYLFQDGRVDPRKKSNAPFIAMKPNTIAFNIALAGCFLFGTTRKAEQLLDMMPRVDIKANANLLIIMANIYERNGRRDELTKLQRHVDEAQSLSGIQFQLFYNCLLTCHLKFGDLDSASNMVLEMLPKAKEARNSLAAATLEFDAVVNGNKFSPRQVSGKSSSHSNSDGSENNGSIRNPFISYEEFPRDQNFLKLEAEAKEVLDTLSAKLQRQVELITTERGILQPTERIYVKLVGFLEVGKIKDLAEFLIKVERKDSPVSNDNSALVHVINSCISLGWLDQANDLLDEIGLAGARTGSSVYASLLKAYCKANRTGEVTSLLLDARKAGIQLELSCYEALIECRVLQKDTKGGPSSVQGDERG